jgi:uncharacterized protein (DUF58 family)
MQARHLRWRLLRRMPGLAQGEFLSLARGSGFDLVHLSPYQAGDDVRRIDWNASARSGELQVRQLQEDRDLSCWLIADLSASQAAGLGSVSKRDQLVQTAAIVIESIGQRGNRLGLWIDDGQARPCSLVPARSGRAHQLKLIERLQTHRPPQSVQPSHLGRLFSQVSSHLKRRSLVIVLSDFLSCEPTPETWRPALAALARRHDVIAVHLEDPSEWALPASGHFMVEDAETGEQVWVDGDDEAFRQRYEQALQEERLEVHQALQRSGARLLTLHPEQDALRMLAQWLRRPVRRRLS